MPYSKAHQRLAEKFMFKQSFPKAVAGDALLKLVEFAYTEEEADVVCALSLTPKRASGVARKLHRPIGEIKPLLKSLGERVLILHTKALGVNLYAFALLLPGVYEFQMIRSKNAGSDIEYFRRFAELFEDVYDEFLTYAKPVIKDKDLRFGRIVAVEKSLERTTGVLPMATDKYSEIVERNNSFCIVHACSCRQEKALLGKDCGRPLDVCAGMGWGADLLIEKGLARRVSREEFMETKQRASEAGLIHMVDNLVDPVQVCSCCTCCCSVMRIIKDYNIPTIIVGSHFEAVINEASCNGCGKCARICPMDAISMTGKGKEKKARIDYARCIGCGLCIPKCNKTMALALRERPGHKEPSKNPIAYYAERSMELTGKNHSLVKSMGLELGSALYNISPIKITGPKYKPKKIFDNAENPY